MKIKRTPAQKCSITSLVMEHAGLNDAIDNGQLDESQLKAAKQRRLDVKVEIGKRASAGSEYAASYAEARNWSIVASV